MKPRRWFQYSLRSLLVLTTVLAVCLGVVVNRAREQREAVKAIEALGGRVRYDWELARSSGGFLAVRKKQPPGPAWLRSVIGDEFFQEVVGVSFSKVAPYPFNTNTIRAWLPHLKRLRELKYLGIGAVVSQEVRSELREAMPQCEISTPFLPVELP